MDRHEFCDSELASSENLCDWNIVDSTIRIKCKWIVQHYSDDKSYYVSPEFSAGVRDLIKYQLFLENHNHHQLRLTIRFQNVCTNVRYVWKSYLVDPTNYDYDLFNEVPDDGRLFKNMTKAARKNLSANGYLNLVSYIILDVRRYQLMSDSRKSVSNYQFEPIDFIDFRNVTEWHNVTVHNITTKWAIPNFRFNNTVQRESPEFCAGKDNSIRWNYQIHNQVHAPEATKLKDSSFKVSINVPNRKIVKSLFWKVYIMSKKSKLESPFVHENYSTFKMNDDGLWKDSRNYLMAQNSLVLVVHLVLCVELEEVSTASSISSLCLEELVESEDAKECKRIKEYYKTELRGYQELLENQQLTDVVLKVEDKEIRAHKAILAARSPIFLEMFEAKPQIREVEIQDQSYHAMQALIQFLYTLETVKEIDLEMAVTVLAASHKYGVARLRIRSENILCDHLALDNVVDLLVIGDAHDAQKLRDSAIAMIVGNYKKFDRSKFLEISRANPQLLVDIMHKISSNK